MVRLASRAYRPVDDDSRDAAALVNLDQEPCMAVRSLTTTVEYWLRARMGFRGTGVL
jgi:hypothetical protein